MAVMPTKLLAGFCADILVQIGRAIIKIKRVLDFASAAALLSFLINLLFNVMFVWCHYNFRLVTLSFDLCAHFFLQPQIIFFTNSHAIYPSPV